MAQSVPPLSTPPPPNPVPPPAPGTVPNFDVIGMDPNSNWQSIFEFKDGQWVKKNQNRLDGDIKLGNVSVSKRTVVVVAVIGVVAYLLFF